MEVTIAIDLGIGWLATNSCISLGVCTNSVSTLQQLTKFPVDIRRDHVYRLARVPSASLTPR